MHKKIIKGLLGIPFNSSLDTSLNLFPKSGEFTNFIPDFMQSYNQGLNKRSFTTDSLVSNLYDETPFSVDSFMSSYNQGLNRRSDLLTADLYDESVPFSTYEPFLKTPTPFDTIKKDFLLRINNSNKSWLSEVPINKSKNLTQSGNIAQYAGIASDLISGFLPEKSEYAGLQGGITQSLDSAYDGISDITMSFGPIGMMVGGIMKGGKLLGLVTNSLGGGTDGMTTTDAILGSSFLNLTPIGLINGFGGLKADTITKDDSVFEQIGSSYTGTSNVVDDALMKSGKKYGLFSSGARNKANKEIANAKFLQNIMSDIADDTYDRFAIKNSIVSGNKRKYYMQGGYNQSGIRMGLNGMSLTKLESDKSEYLTSMNSQTGEIEFTKPSNHPDVQKELDWYNNATEFKNEWELKKTEPYYKYVKRKNTNFLQNGGILKEITEIPDEFKSYNIKEITNILPEFQKGGTLEKNYESTIEYAKSLNFNWINRLKDPNRATIPDWEKEGNVATHKLSRGDGEFDGKHQYFVYPMVQEIDGLLYDFTDPKNKNQESDAFNRAKEQKEILFFDTAEEADWFINHYKEYFPTFDKYLKGGKFNVIPEGALHARKHNMDIEGITHKGIPVVSEGKDGKIELQAEVEREELVLRLEVTKKLEELAKNGSDDSAIEAGKLLVLEILYNTKDNTNNLI